MSDAKSETAKYRHLVAQYVNFGLGVDIASQGDPVSSNAISFDLPHPEYMGYHGSNPNYYEGLIHLRGDARRLPFDSASLDFVYSSHLLEDFEDWYPILGEWTRVLKLGGYLVIILPDKERWGAALKRGQPPNYAHKHEAYVGEISTYAPFFNLKVLRDDLTDLTPEDYSILFVAQRL